MQKTTRLLLIDDCEDDFVLARELLRQSFQENFELEWVDSYDRGIDAVQHECFDAVLVDYSLGERNGLELVQQARDLGCASPLILLTGMTSPTIAIDAMKAGAADYLMKGEISAPLLAKSIRYAMARQEHHRYEIDARLLLEKKNKKLADLYDTAHQFVDNVSHEFRTPLTVIKEFASIIADGLAGELNEQQREFLGIIINRTDDLSLMVDDMLDTSRLEAGLLGAFRQEVSIEQIFNRVRGTLERKSANSGTILEFEIDDQLPAAYCDPENIARVIINLAVNAFKFSGQDGHVKVWAHLDVQQSQIEIGVSDNGPGIPAADVNAIFERFKQVGQNIRSSNKGFGLGLNIVRELVHLNLGQVKVDSEIGQGSTFKFDIPVFDVGVIVNRYAEHIALVSEVSQHVALFETGVPEDAEPQICDRVEQFLQRQLRRSDLLIRKQPWSWLLCTHQNRIEMNDTSERIRNALSAVNNDVLHEDLPEISFASLGLWDLSRQKPEFQQACASALGQTDNWYQRPLKTSSSCQSTNGLEGTNSAPYAAHSGR